MQDKDEFQSAEDKQNSPLDKDSLKKSSLDASPSPAWFDKMLPMGDKDGNLFNTVQQEDSLLGNKEDFFNSINPSFLQSDRKTNALRSIDAATQRKKPEMPAKSLRAIKVAHEHDKLIDEVVNNNFV